MWDWRFQYLMTFLDSLLATAYFFLMVCFYFVSVDFLGRYPKTLSSPTSVGLQGNLGLVFTASNNASLGLYSGMLLT